MCVCLTQKQSHNGSSSLKDRFRQVDLKGGAKIRLRAPRFFNKRKPFQIDSNHLSFVSLLCGLNAWVTVFSLKVKVCCG